MDNDRWMQYEELLLQRSIEIRRLQDGLNIQMSDNTSLVEDNVSLMDDNTKLLDDLAILQEKYERLEMDMDNLSDDYTDQADVHTFETSEKNNEIESLKALVARLNGYAREDDVLIKAMERTVRRQLDEIDYLEKLSAGLHESCDDLENENTALKNARDGLLTFSADEVERLTEEVKTLKYMRGIDDQLFSIISKAWKNQMTRLAKFDDLRKDGTVEHLLMDVDVLVEQGLHVAAEDIQRVVQIIKEDANAKPN